MIHSANTRALLSCLTSYGLHHINSVSQRHTVTKHCVIISNFTKQEMFSRLVCWFVCLSIIKIAHKVADECS